MMKKMLALTIIGLFLFINSPVFAQERKPFNERFKELMESEAQPTQVELTKGVIRTMFIQHQEFIRDDDYNAWLRRIALLYRLYNDLQIFTKEEFDLMRKHDLPDLFIAKPGAIVAWENGNRKYWTQDIQKFIDDIISTAKATR